MLFNFFFVAVKFHSLNRFEIYPNSPLSSNRSELTSSCDALNVTKAALLPEDSPQRRPQRWPPIKRRVPVAQGA